MAKLVPHFWFDREAREAATFYTGLFPDSRVLSTTTLGDTPSGEVEVVVFELAGQRFEAISGGPEFHFNPSISLMVSCATAQEVDTLWQALRQGGTEMMPLDAYPFSPRYGWLADRYGLNWQLMLIPGETPAQRIAPNLLFSGAVNGKAEEAVRFYAEAFPRSQIHLISHYAPGEALAATAQVNYAGFTLLDAPLVAMDNAMDADFGFNEAVSLIVYCDTQQEIDTYWSLLSHVPEAEACGWLKDRYGLSWQIVPSQLEIMMTHGTPEQIERVTTAFMQMKKFDIAALEKAYADPV